MKLKDVLKFKIGGVEFEIVKSDDIEMAKRRVKKNNGIELRHCYGRYSRAKEEIYNEWLRWGVDNNVSRYFGISSYNCMMFTLSTILDCDVNNVIYITPQHNNFIIDVKIYNKLKDIVFQLKKEFNQILKQHDTSRIMKHYESLYVFKKCIENEIPYIRKRYEPQINKVLGDLDNNICDNVINTLYKEYII